MTGHGCFAAYKAKIGKSKTTLCWLCEMEDDHANNALFNCSFWKLERKRLEEKIGIFNVDNFIGSLRDEKTRDDNVCK